MRENRKFNEIMTKQTGYCLFLAIVFFALGLLSYKFRNEGLGNTHYTISVFLGSAPSLFHGAFFLALVSAFDIGLKKLEKNAIVCVAITTILEIVAFRLWWKPETGIESWTGVADFNDITFGFLGISLSFMILKMAGPKENKGDD